MSNQLDYCPYYGKTCECDEDEREVCDLFAKYKDTMSTLLDTRAIKPEKYEELREQDFDTWLTTILHDIIEQVNFDADEVGNLGGAVWNGEFPDGTPYPRQCAREDAYIQCIRQSNQLDMLRRNVSISLEEIERKIANIMIILRHPDPNQLIIEPIEPIKPDELDERLSILEEHVHNIMDFFATGGMKYVHYGKGFCGNCIKCEIEKGIAVCADTGEIVEPDSASCLNYQDSYVDTDSTSNQLDKELLGKPDREECKHCPKSKCDNCMNFPF